MMDISSIQDRIAQYKGEGKELFATSSFQTHSIPLLHIISRIDDGIPIYYLNTGYLFPETIAFKDEIAKRLGLQVTGLQSPVPKSQQKDADGNLLFTSDPGYCCYLNKTKPLEPILAEYDIWINGIRADQSPQREQMQVEEQAPFDTVRFHPMLDWNSKMILDYRKKYELPEHPLHGEGYISIGCEPCTRKWNPEGDERSGRWSGLNKTECGLHTDLVENKES